MKKILITVRPTSAYFCTLSCNGNINFGCEIYKGDGQVCCALPEESHGGTLIQELLAWVPQEHNKTFLQSHRYHRYHACARDQNRAINWEVHNASSRLLPVYGVYASGLQTYKELGGRWVTV